MIGWLLAAATVLGLAGIGVGALLAPGVAAKQYGIVVADPRAEALIRAMGVRDIVLGALLAIVMMGQDRSAIGLALWATAVVGGVDWMLVVRDGRTAPGRHAMWPAWLPHAAGFVGLAVAGAVVRAGF